MRGRICSYRGRIPRTPPPPPPALSCGRLPDKRVLPKIRSNVNPSKFGGSPLSSNLSPGWRVWIVTLTDMHNQAPRWVVRQTDPRGFPHSSDGVLANWVSGKCSYVSPSKVGKHLYRVVMRLSGACFLFQRPNKPPRSRLGSYIKQIPTAPPQAGE